MWACGVAPLLLGGARAVEQVNRASGEWKVPLRALSSALEKEPGLRSQEDGADAGDTLTRRAVLFVRCGWWDLLQ